MKKIIITVITLLAVTGCTDKTINLKEAETNLDKLNDGKFALTMVDNTRLGYENELEYIYSFDYEKTFGLQEENVNVDNTLINYNKDTNELLAIIDQKNKEKVKKEMDKFCNDKCYTKTFKDYLVYIISDNEKEIFNNLKNVNTPIFNNMMKLDKEMFTNLTNIKSSSVEEFLFKKPKMMTSSSSYILIKPKKGQKEEIKEKMNDYMDSQLKTWEMYLPDQYELVKNRLEKEYSGYLIYIISSDNDLVYKEITK